MRPHKPKARLFFKISRNKGTRLQQLVIFLLVTFYESVTFAKMKVVRTNTVWVDFPRMLLLPWQQLLSHRLFQHHIDPGLRNGLWGGERLMLTAATSPWLGLGLSRCYHILADRRESKSAVSDTGGATFSAVDSRTVAAALHYLVETSTRKGRAHWASLTDVPPAPKHEGVACWVLGPSSPWFLLQEGRCHAGRRKQTTSCTSVLSLRSVGPGEVVWLHRNPGRLPIPIFK